MKKIMLYILSTITILSCIATSSVQVYAHDALLNVEYDDCIYNLNDDGIYEMWYALNNSSSCWHLDDNITTIKYYFENVADYEESTNIPINDIKEAYANSMKKWNNIYFYSYDHAGNVSKTKFINVEEGTETDHNLSVFFVTELNDIAITGYYDRSVIETGTIEHSHCEGWYMEVDIDYFYVNGSYNTTYVDHVRKRTGAHELGHVLGLRDIENYCNASTNTYHHHELLMGCSYIMQNRSKDISYKDLVGVAITRGFHTDNDHKWLINGTQNGKYKLICSICNGVKLTDTLVGYVYNTYGQCGQEHALSSGNMMAVASYGDRDYYKCKYCRYVAPFEDIVEQDYSVTPLNNLYHQCENNVDGLEYTFTETHKANRYLYLNNRSHRGTCSCGTSLIAAHSVRYDTIVDGRYANCLGCSARLDLTKDNANIAYGITNMRTANGSYILPNGIVVLVQADLEAYENGTLQFYDVNDQTQTE